MLSVEIIGPSITGQLFCKECKHFGKVLEKLGKKTSKPVSTPCEVGTKITKTTETDALADQPNYQAAIGRLAYLMNATRPDIEAAVNVLGQFVDCPSQQHLSGVNWILRDFSGSWISVYSRKREDSSLFSTRLRRMS